MPEITKSTSLKEILKLSPACQCHECNHGCTIGSGFLAKGDKEKIAKFLNISEKELEQKYLEETELFNRKMSRPKIERNGKPSGKCIFYDGKCSIHEAKPLQCKISMGCKEYGEELMLWFMLNHIIDKDDAESLRQFDAYLKSGGKTLPGGEMEDFADKKTLEKIRNFEILH